MKIISLNTWGARAGHKKFLKFIERHKDNIDIFCFQEVWNVDATSKIQVEGAIAGGVVLSNVMDNLFKQVSMVLTTYNSFFCPQFGEHYGLAIFVRKDIKVIEEGDIFVYKEKGYVSKEDSGNHARNIQYIIVETKKGLRTIINFHGLWNGKGKTDTEDRLLQSDNILNFLKNLSDPFVLCGDFNLLPDTESIKKFENFGLRNLIKEYEITSTRTRLYKKEHRFADYTFVSSDIKVNNFKILPDEVSDHNPMHLDYD